MPHESKSQSEEGNSQQHQGHGQGQGQGQYSQGQEKKEKRREYSEAELQRLRDSMRQEASKIHKPKRKLFAPYTFNGLDPYMDLTTAEFVHEMPTDVRHGYACRHLATGLCDPPVALRMDVDIPVKTPSTPRAGQQDHPKQKTKDDKDRPAPEGSTRLPPYPAVRISMATVPKKKHYDVNDLPVLRHAVNEQCSPRSSRRVEEDYKRTKADFYRMELDKMDEYGPVNRTHMKAAYLAYLQNTAGSSKAVRECVRSVEEDQDQERRDEKEREQERDKKDNRHKDDRESSAEEEGGKEDDDEKKSEDKDKVAKGKEGGARRKNERERQRKREGNEEETLNGKKRDSIKSQSKNDSDSDERENKTTSSTRKSKQTSETRNKNKQAWHS